MGFSPIPFGRYESTNHHLGANKIANFSGWEVHGGMPPKSNVSDYSMRSMSIRIDDL